MLVCAQSNTAVDWICEKLVDRGVPVLRIGNPTRVNDKMLSSTYERRFESHPAYPELWGIRKSIREMKDAPTLFIVSQRAASLMHADRIIVLDDGNVAGIGTHEELLENCEVYQEIYYSQFRKEKEA